MNRILILPLIFTLMISRTAFGSTGTEPEKDHAGLEEMLTSSSDPSGKETVPEAISEKEADNTEEFPAHDTERGKSGKPDRGLLRIELLGVYEAGTYRPFAAGNERSAQSWRRDHYTGMR